MCPAWRKRTFLPQAPLRPYQSPVTRMKTGKKQKPHTRRSERQTSEQEHHVVRPTVGLLTALRSSMPCGMPSLTLTSAGIVLSHCATQLVHHAATVTTCPT